MSRIKPFAIVLFAVCFLVSLPKAHAGSNPTTTTLNISSGSVGAGTAITLTATVTGLNSPVTRGQVTFCDATAAHCDGSAVFGVAQVTSNSTAAIKLILAVGSYSIEALYAGAPNAGGIGPSSSSPQAVTVTGAANYGSSAAIAASGSVGNYTLTGTVTAFGKTEASGTVSFLDASNGNAVVGIATLDAATHANVVNPAPGSPLTTEPQVQYVVSGDFNNNGIPDLAVLNSESNGPVGIFSGKGDGTFQAPVNYNVGNEPQAVAAADLNGDGNLDLITANYAGNNVSVLLGNGDGTFRAQTTYATGSSPTFVVVGDFNGDGWPDLAVPNNGDQTVSVLLGNGDGTFQPEVAYPVGTNAGGVAIGDFNQDGLLDLAVSNTDDGTVSILLGNGNGTFQSQQVVTLPAPTFPYWLASADLRNDGRSDLVLPGFGSSIVYVLLSNGDGTFQPAVGYTAGTTPSAVSIGDVNGDGVPDLVVPGTGDGLLSVLLGNGDGTFASATNYTVGSQPDSVALADLNGDGILDIAVSNAGSSTVTIFLQGQTETATGTGLPVYGSGTHNVLASYSGDADRAPSQSSTVALATSPLNSTATALMASPNPAIAGQSVTLSATITPVPSSFSSLGTVSFYNGTTLVGSGNVNSSGVAVFSVTTLPPGADSITAVYSGDTAFATSTSSAVTETVTQTNTTTTLSATPNPATAGQTVTFTATINPAPAGSSLGSVSFYNGTTLLGSGNVNSSGMAAFSVTTLPAGADSITAVYSGNVAFVGSTSSVLSETVNTTFTVKASPATVTVAEGGSVNINVTVLPVGGTFSSVVNMSASGLPSGATGSFNPTTVTPGSADAPTILTIQLATSAASVVDPQRKIPLAPFTFAFAVGLCGIGFRRKRFFRKCKRALAFAILACAASTLMGCGGTGSHEATVTQPGSYVVTITGTSGSAHVSTTVTVVVQ